jgi:hypothetical protein
VFAQYFENDVAAS